MAALLHDCIEDTDSTHDEIARLFGPQVADLVEGVTKLTRMQYTSREDEQMVGLPALAQLGPVVVVGVFKGGAYARRVGGGIGFDHVPFQLRIAFCLHVMGDRGLLAVERERVCLRRPERKVDLEQAGLMRQLRMFINGA